MGGRRAAHADRRGAALRPPYRHHPDDAPDPLPPGGAKRFRNEASVGASYTVAAKITFNLEYHYNEAGFSRRDWRRWFDAGGSAAAAPASGSSGPTGPTSRNRSGGMRSSCAPSGRTLSRPISI